MADAKVLKDAFTAISTILDEATFNIGAEGISLRAMDPSRVAMVDLKRGVSKFPTKTNFASWNADVVPLVKCIRYKL